MKLIKHTATIIVCLGCVSCIWRTPELMVIDIPEPTEITESNPARTTFQLKSLPEGWTVDRHPVAKWGMSLPTVMSNVMDSAQTVEYWEEIIDLPTGYKLPLKRSKVLFQIITRLTIETVELHFINVDHIYSSTNHEPSHFILNGVVRSIELKPTGFPQLIAADVIKYKFLMEYGTPQEFTDGFHKYENDQTVLKVRELDKSHVQIQMNSIAVDQKLRTAIDDIYSAEGIEYQKKLLLRSIDI
ncbi:MAG: hypothetical protein COA72_09395 [Candidatus Neomarinimicrobiota bacterium]|jgi:hypothetical protein|nr:MAG: hypothetical protein COA72_09395 [Candidatus Neomarinimicrobiota bacterium]